MLGPTNCEKQCVQLNYKHKYISINSLYNGTDYGNLTYNTTDEKMGNVTFWFKRKLNQGLLYTVQLLVNEEIKNCAPQQHFLLHSEVIYNTTLGQSSVKDANSENVGLITLNAIIYAEII